MKFKNKFVMITFLLPCILVLLAVYFYPVARTLLMSFFSISNIGAKADTWQWSGIGNYLKIMNSLDFQISLINMVKLTVYGGIFLTIFAVVFAVLLSNNRNLKGRYAFRTILYTPILISAVALGNAFIYYVYNNNDFGMLNSILGLFGADPVLWLTKHKFGCMVATIVFCSTGYHMMLYISGIERIPVSLYEAAEMDGASKRQQFFTITLPLIKGTLKTSLTFWAIEAVQMFTWNQVFSPLNPEVSTISPIVYMYSALFGTLGKGTGGSTDAGVAAAVGIVTAAIVQIMYLAFNKLFSDADLEY